MREFLNKIKDNRNGKVVTFDFDNTIVKSFLNKTVDGEEQYQFGGVNKEIIKRIKAFKSSGTTVLIVTSRDRALDDPQSSIETILSQMKIQVDGVFYTNGELKARKLYELGSMIHYDDDPKEREAIEAFKKLHKDFDIVVKDPDDMIKDIEEISKGVIITSDNKILIAQRSDSYEWDAPGGHIMDGEEAPFSFWREVKEELGIEPLEVQYLDTLETTWDGVTKPSHYFYGRTDYRSDELEGSLVLQWEIADWFCGSYEEVVRKVGNNMTQNLKNTLQMLSMQQHLIESYQPHSKNHAIKKKRILGLGLNRTTGATGIKNVSDFKRSKSAPPGFGVLEEEVEETPKKTYKIRIKSELDEKKKRKKKKKSKSKKRKWGIYGGQYYDWSFLDKDSDGDGDGGGE